MVEYGALSEMERALMCGVVVVSNLSAVPSLRWLFSRKGLQFEAIVSLMAILSSVLYHLCEVLGCQLYMGEQEWHRLDNVFVIAGLGIYILHLSGNAHSRQSIYFTLVVAILSQEKDAWNIYYTFGPMVFFEIQAIALRVYYWRKVEVTYNFNRLLASIIILLVAGQFFINGLHRQSDYLRINHGLWHFFAGIAHYFGITCTTYKHKHQNQADHIQYNNKGIQQKSSSHNISKYDNQDKNDECKQLVGEQQGMLFAQ